MKNKKRQKVLAPFEAFQPSGANINSLPVKQNESFDVSKKDARKQRITVFGCIFTKYLVFFLLFLAFCNASIGGTMAPFGVGFAFALLLVGENPLLFGPLYVVAATIVDFSMSGFVSAACVFATLLVYFATVLLTKKRMPRFLLPLLVLISVSGYIYFHIASQSQILQTVCYVVVAILFVYVCFVFLRATKGRGFFQGFTLDEQICFSILLMVFALGLFNLYVWEFSVETMFVCFGMLCCSKVFGTKSAIYFCALAGLGLAFANKSLLPLAIFCSWSVVQAALGPVNKYALAIGVLVVDFLLGAYFQGYAVYTWVQCLDILVPGIIFCCIPNRLFEKYSQKFEISKSVSGLYLFDYDRQKVREKLNETAKILDAMGETYQKIGYLQNKNLDANEQVAADVLSRVCKNCENYNSCMREKDMKNDIVQLARCGIEKTRASLVDITKNVANNCTKISTLLSGINFAVMSYAKAEKIIETEDLGRVAIGEQLVGTSKLIASISNSLVHKTQLNGAESAAIAEELLAEDIVAKDVVSVNNGETITMMVKKDEDEKKIAAILQKIYKIEYVFECKYAKAAGYKILHFLPAPHFDLSIGFATKEKVLGKNGDSFCINQVADNKVMLAICDGMGSGEDAQSTSELVLGLVENFYRAGFESELVLKNVAHLLSTSAKETFSTLDVCVFDKTNGNCDFVKASAPPSIHKSGEFSNLISSESLPIGIVETLPGFSMKMLSKGDVVVLASDGVYDSFASDDEYLAFVNNLDILNMNLLCESVLEEAQIRRGEVQSIDEESVVSRAVADDMTVVAFRIL